MQDKVSSIWYGIVWRIVWCGFAYLDLTYLGLVWFGVSTGRGSTWWEKAQFSQAWCTAWNGLAVGIDTVMALLGTAGS